MKHIVWLWLCFGWHAHAQIVTIKDSQSGQVLSQTTLSSIAPKAFTVTNSKGQADISAFKGALKIEVRRVGYKSWTKSFQELETLGFQLMLEQSTIEFEEVVISASKWGQLSSKVPAKISTITAEDVALLNPQTAADLLGASGEVFIQKSQQGGGSPMIRGFATNRLLYTIDGVRMNNAIFRAGNIQQVISLDPLAMESAEVLFGPGSIIYGSDAIGGVMSFQTLSPKFSLADKPLISGNVMSRVSSANQELTNHFDVNIGWKRFSSVTSVTSAQYGDLRMGRHGPEEYLRRFYVQRQDSMDRVMSNPDPLVQDPTGFNQTFLMQKFRFKPSNHWDFQYAFHYSTTSEFSRYDRLIEMLPSGLPRAAVWNYGPQDWMMNHLTVSHYGENKLYDALTLRLAQQEFEESRIDRNFSGGQRFRLRTQQEKVKAYSANIDLEKQMNRHRFYYGAEYVLNEVYSKGTAIDIRSGSPISVADRYPNSTWSSYAAYLSYQFEISPKLLFQSGIRHSGFSVNSDFSKNLEFFSLPFSTVQIQNSATIGSLGLILTSGNDWKITANASSGFRAPNVDDMGKIFEIGPNEIAIPNTSLKAEYAYNLDIGISKRVEEKVKFDLNGFYTFLDDAVVRRAYQVNGQDSIDFEGERFQAFALQNAASARVYGFNVSVEIALPEGFALSSRYSYQLGEEELENGNISRSRHAAPAFGLTQLTFRKDKITLQLYTTYSARVNFDQLNEEERQKPAIYAIDNQGRPFSPEWYTLNLKFIVALKEYLSISGGLENITDQRYRPYSSGLVAPGRNMILALRASF